ncbi:MAG: UDP-N-acetylglucosamine 2-epimerase (hydrolyzing) [Candidatus Cloacimonadota bacterium]|nr:MAG: UDP-N-acetylglucosamine 2-epimerase (hydrolyzing) [Candidatus Cloacimonadota bacterium]
MTKRKICVITGSRAEFGILSNLLKEIKKSRFLELQIVVTGSHLSSDYGETKQEILEDFKINKEVEILLSSDTRIGVAKSMGLAIISLSEVFKELNPDIVLLLGDRFEIHAAATSSLIMGIPIAHIHGGELTQGSWDESLRHSITKLSNLHFTATESYRKRIIQMGENPNFVFNVGSLGVESIKKIKLISKKKLEENLNFSLTRNTIVVTVHSETNELGLESGIITNLLKAIDFIPELRVIFTLSNADVGGRKINKEILNFVSLNKLRAIAFESLGKAKYFSLLSYIGGVVGNSSSGIIEAPSFGIKTLNIGNRQSGRIRASSVSDCNRELESIKKELKKFVDKIFSLEDVQNPFEKKNTANKIIKVLIEIDLKELLSKSFYDLL